MFSSNAAITTGPDNEPIWQTGRQNEFGAKSEFFDQGLSFTVAHFQITEANLSSPNPLFNTDPANNPLNITDQQRNEIGHGVRAGRSPEPQSVRHREPHRYAAAGVHLAGACATSPTPLRPSLLEYRFYRSAAPAWICSPAASTTAIPPARTVTGFTPLRCPGAAGLLHLRLDRLYNAGAGYRWGQVPPQPQCRKTSLTRSFIWQPSPDEIPSAPTPGPRSG